MPPKRLSENPPPAVSSDEEGEEGSESESGTESESEPEPQKNERNGVVYGQNVDKDDDDAEDEETDDDDDDDEDEEEEKESAAPIKKSVATPQKSDSATESDDSESTQPSPPLSAFTIKHHNRSPNPGAKRPAESDSTVSTNTTSKKSKTSTTAALNDSNEKRGGKVTSNDDNNSTGVTLGLLAGQAANQLSSKRSVRASKDKEKVQVKRMILKVEENGVDEKSQVDEIKEIGENVDDLWMKYPSLSDSLEIDVLPEGSVKFLREHLGMIEEVKLKGLNDRWKNLERAELQLFMQKLDLLRDQAKLAVDAFNSRGS